jgi:hypothetical protein
LSKAILWKTILRQADLKRVNLSQAKSWTVAQLAQAKTVAGATMPDGVRLRQEGDGTQARAQDPTFEEWKASYLAQHGGTETEVRNFL